MSDLEINKISDINSEPMTIIDFEKSAERNEDDQEGSERNDESEEIEESKMKDEKGENEQIETFDITPEKSGGVMKQVIKEGEGDAYPTFGDRVVVHYTGWLLSNREKPVMFDSNRKEDKLEFNLGRGLVIKGWDLGLATMKKGEIALFIIQPHYAYGDMGYPPKIPPHTPLLFEIELFEWKMEDLSLKKDNGILRKVIEKGEGTISPNDGSLLKVKLVGYYDEKIFDDREVEFILGEGCTLNIPEGIELALLKFHIKEKSRICLKSKYAFKEGSVLYDIPPDSDVQYEVTLLSFEKVKDIWEMDTDEKFVRAKVCKEKGIALFQGGWYKNALKQFKWILVCLEKEPGVNSDTEEERKFILFSCYLNMALCYSKLKNYIDAVKVCDKALEIDPNNEKALFRRGQAKMSINDCFEALEDFKSLCKLYPENKAAHYSIILCQEKIKKQNLKDKSIYNRMFEKFVKQDEDRLKNMKTETGIWTDKLEKKIPAMNPNQRLYEQHNAVLQDANIIELSNIACL